jgi:DNA-binding NarL/FixJ family response regulator
MQADAPSTVLLGRDAAGPTGDTVGLVLVVDHGLFLAGLAELLKTVEGCAVLGQGTDCDDAVVLARAHRPDIVMLDATVTGPSVGTTISRILRESPESRVLVLGAEDDPEMLREVVDAGAAGFLATNAGPAELLAAITCARRAVDGFVLVASRVTLSAVVHRCAPPNPLTPQESRVLGLLAQGQPNRRISVELFISETTVKRHLTNIYRKLGATSRLQAVTKAAQIGLLSDPPGR